MCIMVEVGGEFYLVIYYDMNCIISMIVMGLGYLECFYYYVLIGKSSIFM